MNRRAASIHINPLTYRVNDAPLSDGDSSLAIGRVRRTRPIKALDTCSVMVALGTLR